MKSYDHEYIGAVSIKACAVLYVLIVQKAVGVLQIKQ